MPVDAYRGAGHPEAIYVVERALNAIARELGIDQAEMRLTLPHQHFEG